MVNIETITNREKARKKYVKYFKKWDLLELQKDQMITVDYPVPIQRYRIVYENFQQSVEAVYFWSLDHLRYGLGVAVVDKITDLFSAAEHSAFFGVAQQRLGLWQDKVTQFLATIGKMVKDLFQLVREIRIIKERLEYYRDSMDDSSSTRESAEITLKGIFIDLVEGGAKSPASVYGLARELQFTTLPDLFFSIHPLTPQDIDLEVDKLEFNRKVREVLKRKLRQYIEWRRATFAELQTKERFTLKYLRQHFDVIKMYMNWVKPYLRQIQRIKSEESRASTPDIVAAFEGSMVEIEILGRYLAEGNQDIYSCILLTFEYRTRPTLSYVQEGYQRGPSHIGETRVTFRSYTWDLDQIEAFKRFKAEEDLALLGAVDSSVTAALDALGDELMSYLKEAGEVFEEEKKEKTAEKVKRPGLLSTFIGMPASKKDKKEKKPKMGGKEKFRLEKEKKNAKSTVKFLCWTQYKNFKKAHGMVTW
jgi:hypothetical protein